MQNLINSTYEHALAYAFHKIDNRGIYVDESKLTQLRAYINTEIDTNLVIVGNNIGYKVYLGRDNDPGGEGTLNLNSSKKLLDVLKTLGFKLPKIRAKNKDTHEYEMKESTNDLVLQKTLANPELWPATTLFDSQAIVRSMLEIRGLNKVKTTYVNAKLHNSTYYSNYNVASTVTGRRGSKKHIFNLGGNAQNFPKHSELGTRFRECLIARPGRLFFIVDQVSAEDWPVQALSENYEALAEMRSGVNRHYKFVFVIFGIPPDICKWQRSRENQDETLKAAAEMQYYLGKKSRHSNNYGMQPQTMSESLAREGYSVSKLVCSNMLTKVNEADPNVQSVFHKYVQDQINSTRKLRTPLGRERQFFGLRSNDRNYKVFNEAYAFIPQSLVGDNNGLAIQYLDGINNYVINDGHDSTTQEIPDNERELLATYKATKKAYSRIITFDNGIDIQIPIEGEIGYNFKDTIKIKDFSEDGVLEAYKLLKEEREKKLDAAGTEQLTTI